MGERQKEMGKHRESKAGRDTEKESRARQTDACRDTVIGRPSERQKDTKGGKREREGDEQSRRDDPRIPTWRLPLLHFHSA